MESKYTYQITHKAKADLDGIVSYIAIDLSNKEAAAKLLQMIQQAIESICSFPLSGAVLINDFLPNVNIRKKYCCSKFKK